MFTIVLVHNYTMINMSELKEHKISVVEDKIYHTHKPDQDQRCSKLAISSWALAQYLLPFGKWSNPFVLFFGSSFYIATISTTCITHFEK
jgi:hypothetical protein